MKPILLLLLFLGVGQAATAGPVGGTFASIDGGEISLEDWRGRPVLVVNTASRCGFTGQYDDMQALYDAYRDRGLVVLAVPSDDFRQELDSDAAVKDFCEVNFGLDLPMTTITSVRGGDAHPFYEDVRAETGFAPRWNFNKILIGPDGEVVNTWGALTNPRAPQITRQIEPLLNRGS
ncbi:glutathione peroxidase [Tropicimonas isoalkanivorans]|uniref:Glutathione peroxidase n=1 Tax=Tropicimonas isoalkanivorans TaxID=441112 RepID=A0A1I1EDR0_9RHOB|nr:glutathione peroxidase [Tropicimonas isoalkanivorans]SFB85294.1 glutathione peroxidase [Tropicimonas isoalkanivorans]